jgi:hypothetical protein
MVIKFLNMICVLVPRKTANQNTEYNVLSLLIGQVWSMSKKTHTQMFYNGEAWFLAVL